MPDITVPVPDDRTAEFYQFFGLWLARALKHPTTGADTLVKSSEISPELLGWTGSEEEVADAKQLWKKLTARAKGMFNLLIDHPGTPYTGMEIATALDIPHGANGVAGVLAWPGRHCRRMNRHLPTLWKNGEDGAESVYWMDAEVATLFSKIRAEFGD